MRIFIAGIMQGSRRGSTITAQTYRDQITDILRAHLPHVEILDPNRIHPDGVTYDRERAKRTFVEMSELAAQADALVAYVPEASMGTAVEMWQAYRAGVPVYTISPLTENWVVFTLSRAVFPDMAAFAAYVAANGLDRDIARSSSP
jgi:hypothetical protein